MPKYTQTVATVGRTLQDLTQKHTSLDFSFYRLRNLKKTTWLLLPHAYRLFTLPYSYSISARLLVRWTACSISSNIPCSFDCGWVEWRRQEASAVTVATRRWKKAIVFCSLCNRMHSETYFWGDEIHWDSERSYSTEYYTGTLTLSATRQLQCS
jgi:hypothetical protein